MTSEICHDLIKIIVSIVCTISWFLEQNDSVTLPYRLRWPDENCSFEKPSDCDALFNINEISTLQQTKWGVGSFAISL